MIARSTLQALAVVLAAGPLIQAAEPAIERPNILFLFLDDLGWRDCGFMGSDYYETPHLDRLAAQGMIFTNAYSCAANCAPARACLLSGQYTPRHEVYNVGTRRQGEPTWGKLQHVAGTNRLRPGIKTWAACLKEVGYATALLGKWHLSKDPLRHGFDLNVGGTHSGSPPRGYFPPHRDAPGLQHRPEGEYLTDFLNQQAVEFIQAHRDQPWMLYLSHFAVHTPLQAKAEIIGQYEQKRRGQRHDNAVMAAMIHSVDEGVGRLVATLQATAQTERTMIIFFSDNGGYGPATSMAPLRGYKGTYYEGGIREPCFVTWPGTIPAGTKREVPIIGVDIYPTLLEVAGASPPNHPLDGVSLLPLLTAQTRQLPDRALFWHFPTYLKSYAPATLPRMGHKLAQQRDPLFRSRPCSIVRHGDWKLHEYFEDGELELYNLQHDVGETTNLATTRSAKAQQLHQMLIDWRARLAAPVPTAPNPNYDAQAEAAARAAVQATRGAR
ncbi:MAG: sulfatase [Planctomycetota bacterium]